MPLTAKTVSLRAHATCTPPAALALACAVGFDADGDLRLSYRFSGHLTDLLIPARSAPFATDGLWQHTCCEAFIAAVDAPDYHEFNFSPATTWAAYRFTAYRERDLAWQPPAAPQIACTHSTNQLQLDACLPANLLPPGHRLQISLTAVSETLAGDKRYWALHHAGERPDFHLRDSFILELERP